MYAQKQLNKKLTYANPKVGVLGNKITHKLGNTKNIGSLYEDTFCLRLRTYYTVTKLEVVLGRARGRLTLSDSNTITSFLWLTK